MEEIRSQDIRLFFKELRSPWRIVFGLFLALIWVSLCPIEFIVAFVLGLSVVGLWCVGSAYKKSKKKRFHNKQFRDLWVRVGQCMRALESVMGQLPVRSSRKSMLAICNQIASNLYIALRRSDTVLFEISEMEKREHQMRVPARCNNNDDLWDRLEDNFWEFKQQRAETLRKVHRLETQVAVFLSSIDKLRMKALGARFLQDDLAQVESELMPTLEDANTQFEALKEALEELQTYSIVEEEHITVSV